MLKIIGAYLAAVSIAIAAYCEKNFIFSDRDGSVEYYLYSASSACKIASKDDISCNLSDFFSVKGICVKGVDKEFVNGFIKRFNAVPVSSQNVEGAFSQYYYTDKIWGYKLVNGKKVNIHVVECDYGFIVATPIIFGAY